MPHLTERIILIILFVCAIMLAVVNSSNNSQSTSQDKVSYKAEKAKLSSVEKKIREATVKIHLGSIAHGTGTVFKYKNKTVVFTAAHVTTMEDGHLYLIENIFGETREGKVIYSDETLDFSVLEIRDFMRIKPVPFKMKNYKEDNLVDLNVFFSSYPAGHSILTSEGRIAGFEQGLIILNSVAWKGSSGASVFSEKGEFIGILFAISVDSPFGIMSLIDNLIWVSPYYYIDWESLDTAIEKSSNNSGE